MPPDETPNPTDQPTGPADGQLPPAEDPTQDQDRPTADLTLAEAQAELERVRAALRRVNREAADDRRERRRLQELETARAQAELTETDRLKAQLAALQTENDQARARVHDTLIRTAAEMAAAREGFQNPADVLALLSAGCVPAADLSEVAIDDNDQVTGIDAAIKALAKARPYLLKPPSPGLGTPAPAAKKPSAAPAAPPTPLVKF